MCKAILGRDIRMVNDGMRGMSDMEMLVEVRGTRGRDVFNEYDREVARIFDEFVEMRKEMVLISGISDGVEFRDKGLRKKQYMYGDIVSLDVYEVDVVFKSREVDVNGVILELRDGLQVDVLEYVKIMEEIELLEIEYRHGELYGVSEYIQDGEVRIQYGHVLSRLSVLLNNLIDMGFRVKDECRINFIKDELVLVVARGSRSLDGTDRVFVIDSVVDKVLESRGLRPYYNTEKKRMRVVDEAGKIRNLSTFILSLAGESFGGYGNITHHLDENSVFDVISNLVVLRVDKHTQYHSLKRYRDRDGDPIRFYIVGGYAECGL